MDDNKPGKNEDAPNRETEEIVIPVVEERIHDGDKEMIRRYDVIVEEITDDPEKK